MMIRSRTAGRTKH